jgi:hypothetical protein
MSFWLLLIVLIGGLLFGWKGAIIALIAAPIVILGMIFIFILLAILIAGIIGLLFKDD